MGVSRKLVGAYVLLTSIIRDVWRRYGFHDVSASLFRVPPIFGDKKNPNLRLEASLLVDAAFR